MRDALLVALKLAVSVAAVVRLPANSVSQIVNFNAHAVGYALRLGQPRSAATE